MTESKPGNRGPRAVRRTAAALAAVAVTSFPHTAHAAGPEGQGWDFVAGFDGARLCDAAGEALWWSGEIRQFSCIPRSGGFSLFVKRPRH
ncbi:hypothetical protein [Spirillospora sp. NPDC029432]|uniref:hypothetical protein n=1 Tax=Spirillospora sp. NPDC029432 TaxID=3154599 RepID=UPI003454E78E